MEFIWEYIAISVPNQIRQSYQQRREVARLIAEQIQSKASIMDTTTADLTLVRRTKSGDRHAFDMLMLKHQRKLARVISRYLKLPQQIKT